MSEQIDQQVTECRGVLEKFLEECSTIPLNTPTNVSYLDGIIRDYLLEQNHEDWMVSDVTQGPQVGGISEGVLCSFVSQRRIFRNPHVGNYRIDESYGEMSVRCFKAFPVKD